MTLSCSEGLLSAPRTFARVLVIRLVTLLALATVAACSGGGGSGGGGGGGGVVGGGGPPKPPSPPFISASLINFPAGSTPVGFVNGVSVEVIDDDTGDVITTAAVTLNGVAIAYNAANGDYEANMTVAPGDPVTLKVVANGFTSTVSGTQFSSLPAISTPPAGGAWSVNFKNVVGWSGGGATTNASYAIGILDAADPNGNLVWPSTGQIDLEAIGTNTVTVPANALTSTGNRLVVVGLATVLDIPNAAPDSSLVIGGFNYAPIEVTNASVTLLSIAVTAPTPTNLASDHPAFAKGSTQQFVATGTFLTTVSSTINLDITGSVSWSSSDPARATIDTHGLASGVAVGPVAFTATVDQVSGSTLQPTTASISANVVAGFLPGIHYPGSSSTMRLANTALGDLDGDGRADAAVLEEFPGSHVLVYHQSAQGTFGPPQVIATDLKVRGVAIADVNGDGWADLIVSGNSTTATSGFLGRIAVFLQDGTSHTLTGPEELTVSTDNVGMVAVADLNGDSRPDVVSVGAGSGGNGVISLFFQDSNGVLGAEVPLTNFPVLVDGDSQLGDMHVADMNHDGLNDIVLQSDYAQLAVVKQGPAGTFSTPDFYTAQVSPDFRIWTFALADLNGDGLTDVVTSSVGGPVNIFYQNVGGALVGPTKLPFVGEEIYGADLDGDGLNDLILSGGTGASILYQATDHSFLVPPGYVLPTFSSGGSNAIIHQGMSIGDVTGDGLLDIVVAWSNEGVFVLPRRP